MHHGGLLEWWVGPKGYEPKISKKGPPRAQQENRIDEYEAIFVARSSRNKWEKYRVEGLSERLFEHFLNSPRTVEGALAFTNRWGLLEGPVFIPSEQRLLGPRWIGLDTYFQHLDRFKQALSHIAIGNVREAALVLEASQESFSADLSCSIQIPRQPGAPAKVRLHAISLLRFMRAELAFSVSGNREVRSCRQCGKLMTIGTGSGRRRRKPGDQVYCGGRCRTAYYRASKAF
jgi:hypothetical protein